MIGAAGVNAAINGETGKMMIYERISDSPYKIGTASADISLAANEEKTVPSSFINAEGNDVTDEFVKYALPLIQGEPKIVFENGVPVYIRR